MTNQNSLWLPPPENLRLLKDEVHVWRVSLNLPEAHIQSLQRLLADDELKRAQRFYFQKDRNHFTIARGVLRHILGRYLNKSPSRLRFCYNSYGKPFLSKETLCFNLSHSHGLALVALTLGRKIGVDLERVRSNTDFLAIAERFFSPQEVAVLQALPEHQQQEGFFNCWTRKEAYIKGKGRGLSIPLGKFAVSLAPGEPAKLLDVHWDSQEAPRWLLQALTPGPGYTAAFAVEQHQWQRRCWQCAAL